MAKDNRVHLKDPDGNDFHASTPSELSTLVYGHGYRVADKGTTVEQAFEQLADKGPLTTVETAPK